MPKMHLVKFIAIKRNKVQLVRCNLDWKAFVQFVQNLNKRNHQPYLLFNWIDLLIVYIYLQVHTLQVSLTYVPYLYNVTWEYIGPKDTT